MPPGHVYSVSYYLYFEDELIHTDIGYINPLDERTLLIAYSLPSSDNPAALFAYFQNGHSTYDNVIGVDHNIKFDNPLAVC